MKEQTRPVETIATDEQLSLLLNAAIAFVSQAGAIYHHHETYTETRVRSLFDSEGELYHILVWLDNDRPRALIIQNPQLAIHYKDDYAQFGASTPFRESAPPSSINLTRDNDGSWAVGTQHSPGSTPTNTGLSLEMVTTMTDLLRQQVVDPASIPNFTIQQRIT